MIELHLVRGRRKNLQRVGWENGTLEAEFAGGRRYHYGGVPEPVKDQLLRSPFPDKLFTQVIRGKYVSERVDTPPSKPSPTPSFDPYELPF